MKRLLAVAVFVLGTSSLAHAQGEIPAAPPQSNDNVAMDFARTSAATLVAPESVPATPFYLPASGEGLSPAFVSTSAIDAMPALDAFAPSDSAAPDPANAAWPASARPAASPVPRYDYSKREYRWQVELGAALVRFRSSVYYATAAGLNSSLSYYLKDWLAIDGAVTSAFGGDIFANERVKYVGYGAGPKFSLERDKLEPWVHVLVGGIHILPQTGLGGQNGFEFQVGGGADYSFYPRFGVRLEGDWLRSHVFGQWQNSGQVVLGAFYRF